LIVRSYLFAPGNNERLLGKVFGAGADAVVLDLEDAVPPAEKARARELVSKTLEARVSAPGPRSIVRINDLTSALWRDDVAAAVRPGVAGVRAPKAESVDALKALDEALARAEEAAGMAVGSVEVACTLESARGVWEAPRLAAGPRVRNLTFGGADYVQDLGIDLGEDEEETLFARSQLVMASRLADIDPPVATVYTKLADEAGLRRTTEKARRLGFFGRSCIHPKQLAVVHEVFTPSTEAVERAAKIVKTYEEALAAGSGSRATDEGQFVDLAVVRRARAVLALALALSEKQEVSNP